MGLFAEIIHQFPCYKHITIKKMFVKSSSVMEGSVFALKPWNYSIFFIWEKIFLCINALLMHICIALMWKRNILEINKRRGFIHA